jgi:hypothetical protein
MSTTTAGVSEALPVCFGAAARAPRPRPCRTPRRRQRSVVPTPAQAQRAANAPCKRGEDLSDKYVCTFGEDPGEAVDTFALIGDSHAGHWRGALAVVAKERHWRGLSIGHSSCPLSRAVRNLPEPARSHCTRWKKAVLRWLAAHPEVSTVFVSQLTGGSGAVTPPGRSPFETQVAGYVGAWRALPPSVRHVIVIRDTPKGGGRVTRHCVERAMARDADAGSACAVPRRLVLDRDPAMVAAARTADDRVRSIDMTRFFCDDRLCPPVVGGALVLKDANHMTAVFAKTLGPFLLERIDRLMAERV